MKFYIAPEMKDKCEKALARMFSRWTEKPKVTIHPVERKLRDYKQVGVEGGETIVYYHSKEWLDVQMVEIEDIRKAEWRLVAGVYWTDGCVTMIDDTLFKHMPKHFGLDYHKCDHCGGNRHRNEAFVLYNTNTKQWVQVGSSCVNKLIAGGKYLANFMVQVGHLIEMIGGCDGGDGFGGWHAPDHARHRAVEFSKAITVAKMYMDDPDTPNFWEKRYWDDDYRCWRGTSTNETLQGYKGWLKVDENLDEDFVAKVVAHTKTLELRDGLDEFTPKLIAAANNEFICFDEQYLSYFAVKFYLDSLNPFKRMCKERGLTEGVKYTLHAKLEGIQHKQSEYTYDEWEEAIFTEVESGITFTKSLSHKGVIDPYKQEDGTYKFNATIRRIYNNKQIVCLSGRLSKVKVKKGGRK